MGYTIIIDKKVRKKELPNLRSAHLHKKFEMLVNILREDPFQTPPDFEELKGDLQGYYSRRLNIQHRLVYRVNKEAKDVTIVSAWSHDYDKINR